MVHRWPEDLERTEYIPLHDFDDEEPTMSQPKMRVPAELPPPKHLDAWNRAFRTFVQGLLAAVVAAALPVLLAATGSIRWTKEWWAALGTAVGIAALTAAISYIARYTHPPNV